MLFRRTSFTALATLLLGLGTAAPPASANHGRDLDGTFVLKGHGWGRGRGQPCEVRLASPSVASQTGNL